MKIESVPVDVLKFDPANARKHDAKNIGAIAGSLDLFGQRKPIVVTGENVVVAGNGTLEAAKSLGWEMIDVVRVPDDWSADQVKAFALADNRTAELADWNLSVLNEQLQELAFNDFVVENFGFVDWQFDTSVFEPVNDSENPRLDQRSRYECPNCSVSLEFVKGVLVKHD